MEKIKRTRKITYGRYKHEIYLLPVIEYEHMFDPLYITFRWLCFYVRYMSVIRMTAEQFAEYVKKERKRYGSK